MKRTCVGCGGEIPPTRHANARTCSQKCRWKRDNQKRSESAKKLREGRPCKHCGGPIPLTRNLKAEYCSLRCRKRFNGALERSKPECREYHRNYHQQNRERLLERQSEYRRENRPVIRVKARRGYHLATYGHTQYAEDPLQNPNDRYKAARVTGHRSGLEVKITNDLTVAGVPFEYEKVSIPFQQPSKPRRYTPDYVLTHNGIIVETKGRLVSGDRQKHLMVKAQHPDLDIRFLFSSSNTRISKQSRTTYAKWCESKGFLYADKTIPQAWLDEPPNKASLEALARLRKEKK